MMAGNAGVSEEAANQNQEPVVVNENAQ